MRRKIGIVLATTLSASASGETSTPQANTIWYMNNGENCDLQDVRETLRYLEDGHHLTVERNDTIENGKVVATALTVRIPVHGEITARYYRGKERCEAALQAEREGAEANKLRREQELKRYE